MDSDEVITVYDDETNDAKSSDGANLGGATTLESDENIGDGNTMGIYDDLDDILDDYLNEGEVSSDDDYGSEDGVAASQKNIFGKLSKPEVKSFHQNAQQTEKDVDTGIVNSHLQEIVDIKNQIQELEDILHEKSQNSKFTYILLFH